MQFQIELGNIRPVESLTLNLDLNRNAPLCIVGRNGAGKTTLAKAIMNFSLADTFRRTASDGALREDSFIKYTVNGIAYEFQYDPLLETLNTRHPVPESLRSLVAVELPIPHGQRFSYFYELSVADSDIRRAIILDNDTRPDALIGFLTRIYGQSRFEELREVKFSRGNCCFYRTENERYVREDYFSSGEFFLVNLFRRLQSGPRLIFVDEIDISLDAAAQARLVEELRRLCTEFSVNVVFTSHSLALMQTLEAGELLYLEVAGQQSTLVERSFSFVKSLMFGFRGWDRYILVEDEVAKLVVQFLIDTHCRPTFYNYYIIEVGGAAQVVSLLQRNQQNGFLASADAVVAILDGDMAGTGYANVPATHCMPLWTLEHAFETIYAKPDFMPRLPPRTEATLPVEGRHKALFKAYRRLQLMTDVQMVESACAAQKGEMEAFSEHVLRPFLSVATELLE